MWATGWLDYGYNVVLSELLDLLSLAACFLSLFVSFRSA